MTMIPRLLTAPAILPPFTGVTPAEPAARSPYRTDLEEVVQRFATSDRRREILRGFLDYRKELRQLRIGAEFQWLAGSFVENPGREPRDVDVVTFYSLTADQVAAIRNDPERWQRFETLASSAKERFSCDAYFVNMARPGTKLVGFTHYWYGLFSHQRGSLAWKGMLEVDVAGEDIDQRAEDALAELPSS